MTKPFPTPSHNFSNEKPSKPLIPPSKPSNPEKPSKPIPQNISKPINATIIKKPLSPNKTNMSKIPTQIIKKESNAIRQSNSTVGTIANKILNKTFIKNNTIIKPVFNININSSVNSTKSRPDNKNATLIENLKSKNLKENSSISSFELEKKNSSNVGGNNNYYNTSNITIINDIRRPVENSREPVNPFNSSQQNSPVVLFINNEIPGAERKDPKMKLNKVEKLINKLVQKKVDKLMGNFIESLSKNFDEKIFSKHESTNTSTTSGGGKRKKLIVFYKCINNCNKIPNEKNIHII